MNHGSDANRVEDGHDVATAHADASPADGFAKVPFLGSSVNVDVALEGVCIFPLHSAKPNDAGHDGIASW